MNARRIALSATVAACALANGMARAEVTPADIGGWGDAWGEEIIPQPAPQRASPPPAPAAVLPKIGQPEVGRRPVAQPVAASRPGPSPSDIGGWGDAWGDAVVAQPAVARPTVPVAASRPVAATPSSGPSPADIGGWGQAWNDPGDADPAAPTPDSPAPASPTPASPGPVTIVQAEGPAAGAPPAEAPPAADADADPVHLTADQIVHDRELGIVTAHGRVEITQPGRTLTADTVSYNLKQDIITAWGNVTLLEPDGNVVFTDYFELTGDFKDGLAQKIRVLLVDRSRMAAASAQRVGGDRTDFEDAAYTACEPCRDNPEKGPLWEAKAVRVTHNQADKTIEYRDAWIELGGVPVMYTPYLSHPDPTVKRKSGLLVPTMGVSSVLGTNVTTPYYWAMGDNQDLTFSPRFLFPKSNVTKAPSLDRAESSVLQRVVLAGDHRWVGREGETRTLGSLTAHKDTGDLRGHINAKGRFDLTEIWRAGYQIERASDDTYLATYGYTIPGDRPWLTTRPYVEGFGRTNYAMIEGFSYQGTRSSDDPGNTPTILPHAIYSYVGQPDSRGAYWTMDADTLAYARGQGTDAGRLSTQVAWHRPYTAPAGDIYRLSTSLRTDGYHANDMNDRGDATSGRVVPQVALNWRFPFIRSGGTLTQVLEPLAMVAASPNGGNPDSIPNEDSIDFELDEINVMRPNRLPGLDRVEGGLRGAYGLRWYGYPRRGGYLSAQVAQGWRAHDDSDTFEPQSGFSDRLSDYVGRFDFAPTGRLSFLNRVRLDKDSFEVRRNENTLTVGPPLLQLSTTYLMFERPAEVVTDTSATQRQYLVYSLSSDFSQYWRLQASASHDLTDSGGPLGWHGRLIYSDECFAFVSNLRRYYTTDRDDGLGGFEISFNVVFKTLGDIPVNVF